MSTVLRTTSDVAPVTPERVSISRSPALGPLSRPVLAVAPVPGFSVVLRITWARRAVPSPLVALVLVEGGRSVASGGTVNAVPVAMSS